jgi:hypothetical protein
MQSDITELGPQADYLFAIPPNFAGYANRKRERERSRLDIENTTGTLPETNRGSVLR